MNIEHLYATSILLDVLRSFITNVYYKSSAPSEVHHSDFFCLKNFSHFNTFFASFNVFSASASLVYSNNYYIILPGLHSIFFFIPSASTSTTSFDHDLPLSSLLPSSLPPSHSHGSSRTYIGSNNYNSSKFEGSHLSHHMAFELPFDINNDRSTAATTRSSLKVLYAELRYKSDAVLIIDSSFTKKDQFFHLALEEARDVFNSVVRDLDISSEKYSPAIHQTNPPQHNPLY